MLYTFSNHFHQLTTSHALTLTLFVAYARTYNSFETSDGVSRKEMATVKHAGAISVEGTVSWTGPDGVQYTLNYVADEHGFQPQGTHLPVGPEPAS